MARRVILLFGIVLVVTAGVVFQVSAQATVYSHSLNCQSVSATGTTDSPFIVIEVYNPDTGLDLYFDALPASGGFGFTVTFDAVPAGTVLEYWVWGSPTDNPNDWDGEAYFYTEGPCKQEVINGAPGIPDGFVFRSILCDTPVYNTAAGQPVGDAKVTTGQTWYVNPVPVDGADGRQWTEIYVSSTTNPFVPMVCVS